MSATTNPTTFEYSKTLDLGDAQCVTYTNTASYSTTDDENDTDEVDSASQTVTYCRPATIGYWKNHMYQCAPRERTGTNGCNNNGPFTAAFLPQLLGNYSVDTTAKALAVFNANNCSNAASSDNNASACLAAQLLGAKLNVANQRSVVHRRDDRCRGQLPDQQRPEEQRSRLPRSDGRALHREHAGAGDRAQGRARQLQQGARLPRLAGHLNRSARSGVSR